MSNFNISSFFDEFEYDSKNYKLYNECTNETNINLNKKILYEGELAIKSANGLFKTRYFRLQDRKLLMFSVKIHIYKYIYCKVNNIFKFRK